MRYKIECAEKNTIARTRGYSQLIQRFVEESVTLSFQLQAPSSCFSILIKPSQNLVDQTGNIVTYLPRNMIETEKRKPSRFSTLFAEQF